MNQCFFQQLGISRPDINLGVGSLSNTAQTAEIMRRFAPVLDDQRACAVMVVGDVNSTLACALVAAKKGIPVIHVEAGLRSFDRRMPEEINRVLTDRVSDLLLTTEPQARTNLVQEGIDSRRIHFVGNVMVDSLRNCMPHAVEPALTLQKYGAPEAFLHAPSGYGVITLHRPSNVDNPRALTGLLQLFRELSESLPLVFAVHPRTRARIKALGCEAFIETPHILCTSPLSYLEMLGLLSQARLVLTDSGGLQEETTALGVPCATLRENTERPVTVRQGTNTVTGCDPARVKALVRDVLETGGKRGRIPELWDGNAALRIKQVLLQWLQHR